MVPLFPRMPCSDNKQTKYQKEGVDSQRNPGISLTMYNILPQRHIISLTCHSAKLLISRSISFGIVFGVLVGRTHGT